MVHSAIFDNILIILWGSILLVEETGIPGETIDLAQITNKHYHIMLYRVHLAMTEIRTHVRFSEIRRFVYITKT
jgi:hypothetical protein